MSSIPTASPGGSSSSPSPTNNVQRDPLQNVSATDRLVVEYLRSRGHKDVAQTLVEDLEAASPNDKDREVGFGTTISEEDLRKSIAVYAQNPAKPGENVLSDNTTVLRELTAMGNPKNIENLVASIGAVGAEDILSQDPTDKEEGFRELVAWVDGSLDMYRPEFRPVLFPIFCHFYLDLIQWGFKDAALKFFVSFVPSLSTSHRNVLHHISTLLLPAHVQNDELAQRLLKEKYIVRLSRSGFALLVGWLTEGIGGEALGAGEGFSGDKGGRGRAAVMRVVNNHLKFEVTSSNPTDVSPHAWEESAGLLASLIPKSQGSQVSSAVAFNSLTAELKLGPAPLGEELKMEMERVLREQALMDRDPPMQIDIPSSSTVPQPGVVSPTASELLPRPATFKAIDVTREVEKVRDARKRIKLEPSLLTSSGLNKGRALPSICAYTLHDVAEGAPCCTFSPDSSLMAAGFSESYIRLWNLKGEKLAGMRSDFQLNAVKDSSSIRKIRERDASSTRKLIGHSGPVYGVAFDPAGGTASKPSYLLSASADSTTRLWSLDTMTNMVAYRGHQNPVWDVRWSPQGVYFATGSRDRTARLWSTDRTSCLRVYAGHLSDVDCVQFHPNSLYLATGSSDWSARLWDVQKGSCVRVFIGHQGSVSALAFSPDGRYLASAGEDMAINLWDLGSGRRIKKMTGHTSCIYSLAFSAESSLLVSGGADWTVRCWDVKGPGGVAAKPQENGFLSDSARKSAVEDYGMETVDLMSTFPTKRTSIINVQITPRNLCMVAGTYLPQELR